MSLVATELRLSTPYIEVACKAWGPEDGRRVFAMHGWLDNAASFNALAEHLCTGPEAVRLVAWDAAGHGRSAHRQSGPYHFIDYMGDVPHCLDALGWDRADLMGHSMGAGIAVMVAGGLPQRISSAVFIEGFGPLSQTPAEAVKRFRQAAVDEQARAPTTARVHSDIEVAVAKRAQVGKMKPDSARALVERAAEAVEGGFRWRSDPRLRITSRQYFGEDVVQAYMRNIGCPCLLIRAEDGWPASKALMDARMACVEDLQVERLAGHHHLHMDDPSPTARAIQAFWRDRSRHEAL